jgi:pimeloyl-ACP methyl ester carboxylesterase
MKFIEHLIDNQGVKIHALEFNPTADGIPLVMVPGMGNAAEGIAESVGPLLSRHTIILSLRGRGKSDSPTVGWRLEDQASDIAAVVHHFGFPRIALFGHSTGASIAARSLPMIESEIAAFIIGDFAPFYPPYSEGWRQHARLHDPPFPISDVALAGIISDAKYTDVSEFLNAVNSKLLILTGEPEKSLLKQEEIAKLKEMFPLARVELLVGCSHDYLDEDPKQSMNVIEQFILEIEAAK